MFADSLFHAEQMHLLRMLTWAGLSIVAATAVATLLTLRRIRSPLLAHFAVQMAGWGVVIGAVAALEWRGLAVRDLAGATRLDRFVWMNIGFDAGYIAIGAVLATTTWFVVRRLAGVGAGIGIMVQGMALLLMHLQLAAAISR